MKMGRVPVSEPLDPFKATIQLVGTQPLFVRANLEMILDIVKEAKRFAPSQWGLEEREAKPYSRQAVVSRLFDGHDGQPFKQTTVFFRRTRAISYKAQIDVSSRPRIGFALAPKLSPVHQAAMFVLGDQLVERFQPDFGVAHLWYDRRPREALSTPWANEEERDAELMYSAADLAPIGYYHEGPTGLGMRTYLGPHYVEQFGRDRIESLPLVVTKLAWGGYRIDLVADPWRADLSTLIEAWRAGMAHLREARIFAEPQIRGDNLMGFVKGERTAIGGDTSD